MLPKKKIPAITKIALRAKLSLGGGWGEGGGLVFLGTAELEFRLLYHKLNKTVIVTKRIQQVIRKPIPKFPV